MGEVICKGLRYSWLSPLASVYLLWPVYKEPAPVWALPLQHLGTSLSLLAAAAKEWFECWRFLVADGVSSAYFMRLCETFSSQLLALAVWEPPNLLPARPLPAGITLVSFVVHKSFVTTLDVNGLCSFSVATQNKKN